MTAQEIPASSSSEEAITAAITAGTAPCLVYNISAAAVPGWVRQGGLVDLGQFDGTNQYITERSGDGVNIYQTDGKYYQMPWKSNPVMVMYNKDIFSKAGIDADNPNIGTFDGFLDAARKIVSSGAAQTAIWPAPTNEFYQPWFDFYPTWLKQWNSAH
ncbi:MAG: extracellular solute-binding protein [Bifidobacterium breve]